MSLKITDIFSRLAERVCDDLELRTGSGMYANRYIKDDCNRLMQQIQDHPRDFEQALREHPKDLWAWKEAIAQKTQLVKKSGGFGRFKGGIRRIFCGSSTESILNKLNSFLDRVFPKQEGFPRKPKYDRHVYLRVSSDTPSVPLHEKKSRLRGMETSILWMKDQDPKGQLKKLTHHSKLFINGHGLPSAMTIEDTDGTAVSAVRIARFLKEKAPQLIGEPGERKEEMLTISLLVCEGAKKDPKLHPFEKSFAESLSIALCQENIPAKIKGAVGTTGVQEENGIIQKLVDYQKPGPKSHITYVSRKNPQTGSIETIKTQGETSTTITRDSHQVSWILNPWRGMLTSIMD